MIDSVAVLTSLIVLVVAVRQLLRLEGGVKKAAKSKWRGGAGG